MIIKSQIVANFERGAKTYEKAASFQAQVAQNVSKKLANISAQKILEMGCGTGLLSQKLFNSFPQANFVLVDNAPAMIATCRQRFLNEKKIQFVCTDGEGLSFATYFDLIVSTMTIHWFHEPIKSLKHLATQLNKNGRFYFAILGDQSFPEWQTICAEHNIMSATPPLPSAKELANQLSNFGIETRLEKQRYSSLKEFLQMFKLIGADTPRVDHRPISAGKMRAILKKYHHEIDITYEVIYGEYENS